MMASLQEISNNERVEPRRQKAREDAEDIRALKGFSAWNRYFLPRLRRRIAELEKDVKYGEIAPDKREHLRQRMLELEEIEKTMARDEAQAISELS